MVLGCCFFFVFSFLVWIYIRHEVRAEMEARRATELDAIQPMAIDDAMEPDCDQYVSPSQRRFFARYYGQVNPTATQQPQQDHEEIEHPTP